MSSRNKYKKHMLDMLAPLLYKRVLPTEKSLVVSFWTFYIFLGNQRELEKTEATKNFC